MSIDPQLLKSAILNQDDFGHELRVGHILSENVAFETTHGGTYSDPVTQKPRQYDFRTRIRFSHRCVLMAIECKNLFPTSPLVICGRAREEKESFHYVVESRWGHFEHKNAKILGGSEVSLWVRGNESIYKPQKFVGKSIVRLKPDKSGFTSIPDTDIYDRWSQAIASSSDLVREASGFAHKSRVAKYHSAILPIVVVPDGTLWTATYDAKGDLDQPPVLSDKAELFLNTRMKYGIPQLNNKFVFSHIHFFTLSGFKHFTGWLANNEYSQMSIFSSDATEV